MKTIFLLLLPIFINAPRIDRGYHQLTWKDFQGKRPAGDIITAARITTELNWGTGSESSADQPDTVIHYNAFTRFDPETSYTTTSDVYVLKHEQGHLDICEIVAREANRNPASNKRMSVKEWHDLQASYIKEWNDLDSVYDSKTSHSLNHFAQEKWNQWIAEQLKK